MPARYVSKEICDVIKAIDTKNEKMELQLSEIFQIAFGVHRVFILCVAVKCNLVVYRSEAYCSKHITQPIVKK